MRRDNVDLTEEKLLEYTDAPTSEMAVAADPRSCPVCGHTLPKDAKNCDRCNWVRPPNAETAARLVAYLMLGAGRDVTGKLISALWDRWDVLHRNPDVLAHRDVFTLRHVVPRERNLSLDG